MNLSGGLVNKLKAFMVHLLLSVLIIFSVLAFAYFVWYDQIYVQISGVMAPAKMLVLVDVVLGPLMTLLIYKKGKKNLRLDLLVIGLVQLAALIYGVYTLYLGKPSLVVMKANAAEIIIQKNIDKNKLNEGLSAHLSFLSGPQYAYIPQEQLNIYQSAFAQQEFIRKTSVNQVTFYSKVMGLQQVQKILSLDDAELKAKLNVNDLSGIKFYLMNDGDWYAVLVADESAAPLQILIPNQ